MFEKIRKKIEHSKVYKTNNGYKYFVYPYKGLEPVDPKEINYLAKIVASRIDKDVDLLFTFEIDGIFITSAISLLTGKPLVAARKFHYNLKNPIKLIQQSGYYKRNLFFSLEGYNIKKVAIIDCIHSTGGSIKAALKLFDEIGADVRGIYVVVNKINYNDHDFLKRVKNKFFAIYDVEIIDNNLKVYKSKYFRNKKPHHS